MTKSIVVSSVVPVIGGHSGAANFAQHMRQRKREKIVALPKKRHRARITYLAPSCLIFQVPKSLLHVFIQILIILADLGLAFFDRILKKQSVSVAVGMQQKVMNKSTKERYLKFHAAKLVHNVAHCFFDHGIRNTIVTFGRVDRGLG